MSFLNILFRTAILSIVLCSSSAAQNAFLNDGASVYTQSSASIYIQGNLENKSAGSFTNSGGIYISGNLVQNGSVNLNTSASGYFILNGAGTQFISGTRAPDFYNLTLEKSSGECHLQTGITLSNELMLSTGSLFLNNQQIDLLTSGRLMNETSANRVYDLVTGTGTIKVINTLNTPLAVNPGNLGAVITSLQNMGNTTVTRGHQAQFIVSANSIGRYYDINPLINSSLNATLTFNYFEDELNGQPEDELAQWHLPNGSAVWIKRGGLLNMPLNYVTLTGIDSFNSRQSLVSRNVIPLPIKLIEFTATKIPDAKVLLNWKTADEVDFSRFYIERSSDERRWERIGIVNATGTMGSIQHYQFTDLLPLSGLNYYRLKLIDTGGPFTYSVIRIVRIENISSLQVYPTLTKSSSQLFLKGAINGRLSAELYDNKGRLLFKAALESNSFQLPSLTPGTYHIRITDVDNHSIKGSQQIIIF